MASNLTPVQQVAHDSARAHLLSYDIHPEMVGRRGRFDPSSILWGLGARLTESVWVIPDKNVIRLPLGEWRDKYGMEADLVRFDERDADAIKKLALRGLKAEAARLRESLEQTRVDLTAKVELFADDAIKKKSRGCANNALRRAKKGLESLTECAAMFDIMGDVKYLLDAGKQAVRTNDALFYGWFKEAGDPSVAPAEQLSALTNDGAVDAATVENPPCVTL